MKTRPIHVRSDDHDRIKLVSLMLSAKEGRKVTLKETVTRMVRAFRAELEGER